MAWCLLPKFADEFLAAIKDGRLSPERLMAMSSAERRAAFSEIVGPESAHEINASFESKLLLQDQKAGLVRWASKVGGLTEPARRDILNTIGKLDRVLNPDDEHAFLEDLAAKKLGVTVTAEEAKNIFRLTQEAEALRTAPSDRFSGVTDEFLTATENLKAYISSLKPVSAARSIGMNAAVIARNNLLMNPATPIKTTIGQLENSAIEAVVRRVASGSLTGLNHDLSVAAKNEAWETYRKTGLNVAGMETLNDTGRLGEGRRFDIQGGSASNNAILRALETGVRNVAALSNKVIIDWAHVAPFTKFYQNAFYDMANIVSSNVAKTEGAVGEAARARAEELFRDATKVVPETQEGAMVRHMAQQQGARVTSTNSTVTARLAMGVKDALNKAVWGLGDALMPIAKIPANIIWNGIENAGVGIPLGVRDIFLGREKMQSADLAARYEGAAQLGKGIQTIARTFGTVAVAAYFASQLSAGDFRKDRFGQSYVRIGHIWINMEYVSAVSPALAGMMTAKMDATPDQSTGQWVGDYIGGAAGALKHAPGISELSDLADSVSRAGKATGFKQYAENFFTSRAIPAFLANMMKGRVIDRLFFGAHGVETEEQVKEDKYTTAMHKSVNGMSVWGTPQSHNDLNDPINKALEQDDYAPSFPEQKIRGIKLTNDQYAQYVQTAGRLAHMRLEEVIGMPGWDAVPRSARVSTIKSVIRSTREAAANEIMLQSQGSSHDILKQATDAKMAAMGAPQ